MFTIEHTRFAYYADFAIYLVAVSMLPGLLWQLMPSTLHWALALAGLFGLVLWSLVEYAMHRFMFHGVEPFQSLHAEHHLFAATGFSLTRRHFVRITPFAGLALLAACSPKAEPPVAPAETAPAATPAAGTEPAPATTTTTMELPMVEKGDAQAMALGYVDDATQADTVKFNNYVAGSDCGNCILYQGKAGDAVGACPLFAGKNVAAKGWCTSWAKKD